MKHYDKFLTGKSLSAQRHGICPKGDINNALFDFQKHCVEYLLNVGRGGLFLDTGMGKTLCQLEWCAHAGEATNGRSLILTPLAVAKQIEREGKQFGYQSNIIRSMDDAKDGISVCNYDMLHAIDPDYFGAVSLDESSILKSFTGKTTRALISAFSNHRFRLSATATPAPNDHTELGNHSEFCGIMQNNEMLSSFFINDTSTASQNWRLKKHGVDAFWDWMASWSRMAQSPADLGFNGADFDLPPLQSFTHHSNDTRIITGGLFGNENISATGMHKIKRQTAAARAKIAADLVNSSDKPWVVWVDTDYEADAVKPLIEDALEVRGSMPPEKKEKHLDMFADGSCRVMITKPSVCGFGLNWQHCCDTVFVGRTFSYESWYQAIRRFWRFGQKNPVNSHIIIAEGEESIGRVIDRKASDHADMKESMRKSMMRGNGKESIVKASYKPKMKGEVPKWLTV